MRLAKLACLACVAWLAGWLAGLAWPAWPGWPGWPGWQPKLFFSSADGWRLAAGSCKPAAGTWHLTAGSSQLPTASPQQLATSTRTKGLCPSCVRPSRGGGRTPEGVPHARQTKRSRHSQKLVATYGTQKRSCNDGMPKLNKGTW